MLRFVSLIRASVIFALLLFLFWVSLNWLYPLPRVEKSSNSINVLSSEGEVLRQFADPEGIFRIPTTVKDVSPIYIDTLLAYEDQHFYSHPGVDVFALARALYQHAAYGRVISGGSTITMQVARLLYPYERSYWGKLVQIYRALQLEQRYDKQVILDLYLTLAPMGGNIEGVEAASLRYLGKTAGELNITDAALLTVLPQRPSVYRPDRFAERAKAARNKVLKRLRDYGKLSHSDYELLSQEPMLSQRQAIKKDVPLLARELKGRFPSQSEIHTHINRGLQADIDAMVTKRFSMLSNQLSNAIIVMENKTGNVIAYKGSLSIDNTLGFGHVDMTKAVRSPGSTLKPFIYAFALDQGLIHSESLMLDVPTRFGSYHPQNFDRRFEGGMSAANALRRSINVIPVYLLNQVGVDRFIDSMESSGVSFRMKESNLTLALGGGGSTLRELVSLYASLNRGGVSITPKLSQQSVATEAQLLTAESAWITKTILEQIRPPDRAKAKFGRKIAWKTGTSYGFRDAWAIGTSADYTVGVWIGRPDGSPYVGQTGASQAGPVLFDVFDLLPKDKSDSPKPDSVIQKAICWPSGLDETMVDAANCLEKRKAWTINGHTPRTLRRDNAIESLHKWPKALALWSATSGESGFTSIEIISPKNNSHIYPYQGQLLELKASSDNARWFLDGTTTTALISLDELKGRHRITACDVSSCAEVEIDVH